MPALRRAPRAPARLEPADRKVADGVPARPPHALATAITRARSSRRDHPPRAQVLVEQALPARLRRHPAVKAERAAVQAVVAEGRITRAAAAERPLAAANR